MTHIQPLKLNPDAHKIIVEFIVQRVRSASAKGVVVGMSGGIDSALVAKLSIDALGKDKVLGIMLPAPGSARQDIKDAELVAAHLGMKLELVDIAPVVNAFSKALGPNERELGNIKSRARMVVLHQRAMKKGYLVAGTGNKSELLVGYFTKYGDGGVDILPLGDLYKTQVWLLAEQLGLPKKIIKKVPTAGLSKGQTDEGDLGIKYMILDQILSGIEKGRTPEDISRAMNVPLKQIERIERMVEATHHKRKLPFIPKIGIRTIGIDWRE